MSEPMHTDATIRDLMRDAQSVQELAEITAANVKGFLIALQDARDALAVVLKSKRLNKRDKAKATAALKVVKLVLIDRDPA